MPQSANETVGQVAFRESIKFIRNIYELFDIFSNCIVLFLDFGQLLLIIHHFNLSIQIQQALLKFCPTEIISFRSYFPSVSTKSPFLQIHRNHFHPLIFLIVEIIQNLLYSIQPPLNVFPRKEWETRSMLLIPLLIFVLLLNFRMPHQEFGRSFKKRPFLSRRNWLFN